MLQHQSLFKLTACFCSFLERQSCSLSSIPFSIQPDQMVQHVIDLAEGLSQPSEADNPEDEASSFSSMLLLQLQAASRPLPAFNCQTQP